MKNSKISYKDYIDEVNKFYGGWVESDEKMTYYGLIDRLTIINECLENMLSCDEKLSDKQYNTINDISHDVLSVMEDLHIMKEDRLIE